MAIVGRMTNNKAPRTGVRGALPLQQRQYC